MDSNGKLSIEEIITRLKVKKNEIMKEEDSLKDKMSKFYTTLRQTLDCSQKEVISRTNQEVLDFQEKIGGFIKQMSRNSKNFEYSKEEERVNQLLETKIVIAPKVDLQKLESVMRNLYEVKISSEVIKGDCSEYYNQIPEIYSENSSRIKQTPSELLVQKMQEERDYYMLREQQLNSKIKELQNALARKGLNIKEMSKSYLEQKCSKWSLDRLKEEKKILVEKIGEASQEIIRLNSQASEYQLEIRKLNNFLNQMNGRSVVGSSIIKNSSLLMDTQLGRRDKGSYIEQTNRDKQIELELKNEQLIVQITKLMKRTQEDSDQLHALQIKSQSNEQLINQLQDEINQLKQTNQIVNHDYEISLRRKAAFEQECGELKNQLHKLNQMIVEEKQTYKNIIRDFEQKQKEIINQVKSLEQSKEQEISRLEVKLKGFQIERERLVMNIEELSSKKGQQVNVKQLLNDQINRLLKQNAILSSQIQLKEENAFMLKEQNAKLNVQNKQLASKVQISKKEATKFKKQNKQFEKQFVDLEKRLNDQQNMEFKVAQLDQNYHTLHYEYVRYKQSCERKVAVNDRIINLMKERFSNQISNFLMQEAKTKVKKMQNKQQIIERYIEEMVNLSAKTAQIKQLKQQIRELKQVKQAKNLAKKTKCLPTQESITNIENGLWMLGTKIMQQRLKAEKSLFEEQIKESKQMIAKQEGLRLSLQQQLQRERIMIVQMRSKQKQEQNQQDSSKITKQYEQKLDKMESELKGCRAMIRKLQTQISESQAEVKSKRELAIGLKKQCKQKEDIIKELKIEINFSQEELQKLKRSSKEMAKKEAMFKQIKDKQTQLEEENVSLKRNVEALQDRLKLLNKQMGKKDEVLKELRSLQERQIKTKEQGRIKEANETINDHKESIRKLKAEVDRKDQIIKNLRGKTESKSKQLEEIQSSKEKQLERLRKDLQICDRKLETTKNNCKKQQTKNFLLGVTLKKLYQYCISINIKEEKTIIKQNRQESTQYFSGSSASSHILKSSTPINNFKATPLYQGLAILNLSTEDLFDIKADTLAMSKIQPHCESYQVGSPIISKRRQQQRDDLTHQGIEQLQKMLNQKQIDSQTITNLFKRALQR